MSRRLSGPFGTPRRTHRVLATPGSTRILERTMIARFRRAWALMGRCLEVVRSDPELLLLRLAGIGAVLPLGIVFLWLHHVAARVRPAGLTPMHWGIAALAFIAIAFVSTFVNAAAIASAVQRLRGGEPTLRDALGAAAASTLAILGWTIVAATAGLLVRVLAGRTRPMLARVAGATWSVVTFLVVPVIVVERTGPLQALRRSRTLLRQAWGEQLIGRTGFGLPFSVLAFPGVALFLLFLLAVGTWPPPPWMWLDAAYLVTLAVVHATLSSVLAAALYVHAVGGEAPQPFAADLLAGAVTVR